MKVLIVDNANDAKDVLGKMLIEEGYECIFAENSREVIDRVYAELPDIIILDARNKITVFSHDKNNTLSKLTDFIIDDSQLVFIKTADMNHDQYDDIIVGYTHDLKLTIYFNLYCQFIFYF